MTWVAWTQVNASLFPNYKAPLASLSSILLCTHWSFTDIDFDHTNMAELISCLKTLFTDAIQTYYVLVIACLSEDRLLTRLSPIDQSSRYATDSMKCLTFVTTDCNNATVPHNAFVDHSRLQDTQACPSQKTFLLKQHDFKFFQCRSMAWSLSPYYSFQPSHQEADNWLAYRRNGKFSSQPRSSSQPRLSSSLLISLCRSLLSFLTPLHIQQNPPGFPL